MPRRPFRPVRSVLRPVLLAVALLAAGAPARAADLTVFAAASLKTALDAAAERFETETGSDVAISYAGSSALAKQIGQGAPADVFLLANPGWMDVLEQDGLLLPDTRRDLWGNALVLIAAPGTAEVKIGPTLDLPSLLGDGRLAMALVDAVPAGLYGKAALTSLGLWDATAPHVAQAANVRAALGMVATGEAPYGIVYATDAVAEPRVEVVGTFPAESHPPIVYPGAALTGGLGEDFLDFLTTPEAGAILAAQGFRLMSGAP